MQMELKISTLPVPQVPGLCPPECLQFAGVEHRAQLCRGYFTVAALPGTLYGRVSVVGWACGQRQEGANRLWPQHPRSGTAGRRLPRGEGGLHPPAWKSLINPGNAGLGLRAAVPHFGAMKKHA